MSIIATIKTETTYPKGRRIQPQGRFQTTGVSRSAVEASAAQDAIEEALAERSAPVVDEPAEQPQDCYAYEFDFEDFEEEDEYFAEAGKLSDSLWLQHEASA